MKCKDIERLIIDSSEEELTKEELFKIEQHVSGCAKCARFQEDLNKIRVHIKKMPALSPSAELVEKTQALCHAELNARKAPGAGLDRKTRSASMPRYMWAALPALIILTTVIIFPLLKDFKLTQSFRSIMALTLIVQNAVMLCFAPILIRKFRLKKQDFSLSHTGWHAS